MVIVEDLIELIPKAMHSRPTRRGRSVPLEERWRYYCGVVWGTVEEIGVTTSKRLEPPRDGAGESTEMSDEELTADVAYSQGFEDGRNYERSRLIWHPPQGENARLCAECDERPQYGNTGLCMQCWTDQLGGS